MANVAIARYDAATGWLPAVCPKHGARADRSIKRKFYSPTPWWAYLTIFIGILPFALIVMAMRKTDEFTMPSCTTCQEAKRRVLYLRVGVPVAGIALCFLSASLESGALATLGLLLLLAGLLLATSLADPLFTVNGHIDDQWLHLKGVHQSFASGLRPNPAWQPQYAAAPAQWQQPQWQQPMPQSPYGATPPSSGPQYFG